MHFLQLKTMFKFIHYESVAAKEVQRPSVLGNMGLTEAENEHIFRDFAS
jgi:hypothetical protein